VCNTKPIWVITISSLLLREAAPGYKHIHVCVRINSVHKLADKNIKDFNGSKTVLFSIQKPVRVQAHTKILYCFHLLKLKSM